LDILSNRIPHSNTGHIYLNDKQLSKAHKRQIGYVKQEDIFFDHLTVRDQLLYTALLRLPSSFTKADKISEVDRIISILRLNKCANTPIHLISGGEKKRTNIGTELLTDPNIIMLDEPTSGLDSTSAVALLRILRELATNQNKTIITSIHQPSSAAFAAFDKLLLLADGHVVYSGTPKHSLNYFNNLGFPCPVGYNGADHVMDLLVVDSAADQDNTNTRAVLIEKWNADAGAKTIEHEIEQVSELSERALWKTSILAMKCAKWIARNSYRRLQTTTSTN